MKKQIDIQYIRNFAIVAHIDHGKSTLADCLIQYCGGLNAREMQDRVLDSMELERERGITIKAHSVTLYYTDSLGQCYQLNLLDTPGHVDFSYEVYHSLSACEGVLLIVDAAQSVEAQTVAVCYMALEQELVVIPILNKIDLPQADVQQVIRDIEEMIGIEAQDALQISAKQAIGINAVLERIIKDIPKPIGDIDAPLQALIIDSWFDPYLGVVSLVRIKNGRLFPNDSIQIMSTNKQYEVTELGIFTPKRVSTDQLSAGEIGYLVAGIKEIYGAPVGDTITHVRYAAKEALPGFKKVKPQVYAGLFPIQSEGFAELKEALSKLQLNDAALSFEPETSDALGFGFRCGFLGLLHMEIVRERLEREYHLQLMITAPSVIYEIVTTQSQILLVDNPSKLPPVFYIAEIREPIAQANILMPKHCLGNVMSLCVERRGIQTSLLFHGHQVALGYELPMNEIVMDFFDRLKSISHGYASLDYHFTHFQAADLVKLDILINNIKIDALAIIVHRTQSYRRGRLLTEKLREVIPRQMFDVAIQAAIGSHIIARQTVRALRKNVIAKCYGGDVSRKRKLLEKQKAGKKRMKQLGNVEIPQEAFLAILTLDH